MNSSAAPDFGHPHYPRGFRARRGLNWGFIGLLYTSYYMCRYNFSIANKSISNEFGFSRGQMGTIMTTALLAYACGQIINGLLTDKLGGKRAMLIGAAGTILMNTLFGFASLLGAGQATGMVHVTLFQTEFGLSLLSLFVVIRGIDGYLQAFGSPGMVKMNTAWFAQLERGRFAGIFGFMINLGRFGIFNLGPALLAGFTFLWMWKVPPLHWRWLFWVPAMICAVVAIAMAFIVKETPEEAGFPSAPGSESDPANTEVRSQLGTVFRVIVSNPIVWITALAYACTGAVRQSVDQWFPRFMEEVHHMDLKSAQFKFLGFLIPFVASAGSLISGYISDTVFKGHRAPNIHADVEWKLIDDEFNDYPALREEYWAAFEKNLKELKDPIESEDVWLATLEVSRMSYDALPLIGRAAVVGYKQGDTGVHGDFDADMFYHFRGKVGDKEMSVLEMKAWQTAWGVKRVERLWRKAWEDAKAKAAEVPGVK